MFARTASPRPDTPHRAAAMGTRAPPVAAADASPVAAPPAHEAQPWLDALNPEQRAAAMHPAGPLLILAGAGTGKTTTLCARVAWLVGQGVSPERILLLTFTRRAAREMLGRAQAFT